MAAPYGDGSRLVNGDSVDEGIIMFVRHAPMRYGANWSPGRGKGRIGFTSSRVRRETTGRRPTSRRGPAASDTVYI